jgi:type I restriction enzyme M protein
VKEQDYSLNPGRYVGVVIEEDGRTEEEFIEEVINLNEQLSNLSKDAALLESEIKSKVSLLFGGI